MLGLLFKGYPNIRIIKEAVNFITVSSDQSRGVTKFCISISFNYPIFPRFLNPLGFLIFEDVMELVTEERIKLLKRRVLAMILRLALRIDPKRLWFQSLILKAKFNNLWVIQVSQLGQFPFIMSLNLRSSNHIAWRWKGLALGSGILSVVIKTRIGR